MIGGDVACPGCGEPCAPEASFCETCGTALTPGAARMTADPTTAVPTADATGAAGPPAAAACAGCGGTVLDDGFCDTCGQRARTPRDHWAESPSTWVGGVCDKGIVHIRNEDAMALASLTALDSFAALVVCDGVTSAPDSDQASIAAARAARDRLVADATAAPAPAPAARRIEHWSGSITKACALAQRETVAVAEALGTPPEPPSCTFVAAVVDHDLISVGWCGDSRAYWIADDGGAAALTTDHSLGTEMIARGVDPAAAEADPTSHTITRWLGADSHAPVAEFRSMTVPGPGWLVVCSDGLWNYASSPSAIAALISEAFAAGATTPTDISASLVEFANTCGGHDNITVALARVGGAPTAPAAGTEIDDVPDHPKGP